VNQASKPNIPWFPLREYLTFNGRGRDEDCSSPPAQIPACAANVPGSSLGSNVGGTYGLEPHALRRTAANRIDVAARLSVRTTAACRLFPSGEALPSTTSAGSCLPLFGASSVLRPHPTSHPRTCSACGYCLPEPARHKCRARVRPPRFRAKNFPTCTRSPTARGSSMQASTPWKMLPSLQQYEIGTSELDPFRSSILGPWSPL
jgi:hypothetical protein